MEKTEMPVDILINRLAKVIPCTADENKSDNYKEFSIQGKVTKDQIKVGKAWCIDINQIVINAATNELLQTIIERYLTDIKDFGEQTSKKCNCTFTESFTYNIDYALNTLASLHKDEAIEPVIFMTHDKCQQLFDNPDFVRMDGQDGEINVPLYGKYKNVEVYEINMVRPENGYAVVCYNKDYILHYSKDSLHVISETSKSDEINHSIVFNGIFINEQAENNYLTIK